MEQVCQVVVKSLRPDTSPSYAVSMETLGNNQDLCGLSCVCVLDCFFKQSEWSYALADYQQAEEMQPHDPAVRRRLAVLHNTLGSSCFKDGSEEVFIPEA